MAAIRIGILGAARIVPMALTRPAAAVAEVQVAAIAARDKTRADAFARRHGIPNVFTSYADLVASPDLDAVYIPLPNNLHCEWTIRALEAGKHVLCEKPLTANTAEAIQAADAARRTGRILMEAFHWRYHPLAAHAIDILRSGRIGRIQHVETALAFPLLSRNDIRFRLDLAGGAMMDAGCYTVHMLRHLSGEEPEVVAAKALLRSPDVDRYMTAEVRFPSGATGRVTCSLLSSTLLKLSAVVKGDKGELRIFNPIVPQLWHRLTVRTAEGRTHERVPGEPTYTCQLRAFVAAVTSGAAIPTGPEDSIANMRVIDSVYTHAGLSLRGGRTT